MLPIYKYPTNFEEELENASKATLAVNNVLRNAHSRLADSYIGQLDLMNTPGNMLRVCSRFKGNLLKVLSRFWLYRDQQRARSATRGWRTATRMIKLKGNMAIKLHCKICCRSLKLHFDQWRFLTHDRHRIAFIAFKCVQFRARRNIRVLIKYFKRSRQLRRLARSQQEKFLVHVVRLWKKNTAFRKRFFCQTVEFKLRLLNSCIQSWQYRCLLRKLTWGKVDLQMFRSTMVLNWKSTLCAAASRTHFVVCKMKECFMIWRFCISTMRQHGVKLNRLIVRLRVSAVMFYIRSWKFVAAHKKIKRKCVHRLVTRIRVLKLRATFHKWKDFVRNNAIEDAHANEVAFYKRQQSLTAQVANKTKELCLEIRLQNQIQRRVTEAQFACHLQQLQNAQALLTTCVGNEDKLRIQRMQHEMYDVLSLNRRVEHYAAEQERGKIILEERRSVIQDLRTRLTEFQAKSEAFDILVLELAPKLHGCAPDDSPLKQLVRFIRKPVVHFPSLTFLHVLSCLERAVSSPSKP